MERTERLGREIEAAGADAFLAWSPVAVGYLADFWEHPHRRFGLLAVGSGGRSALIVPALGAQTAREAGVADVRPWTDDEDPLALFAALAEEWDLRAGVVLVEGDLPTRMLLAMQAALPAALFRDGDAALAALRRRKEPAEIASLERAGAIVDAVWEEILPHLVPGARESEIAARLEAAMRARGMTPAFSIVGSGPNSAKPHHRSGERPLAAGEVVLLDFGGAFEGYAADVTRVVHLGPAPERVRHTYAAVHRAHEAARLAIRPGTTGAHADAFAREGLRAEGLADFFVHRLGHGIGLQEHEEPYLVATNAEPLEESDAFTIEPGVYFPGEFGVRLENSYVLESGGPRSFNAPIPPSILELTI